MLPLSTIIDLISVTIFHKMRDYTIPLNKHTFILKSNQLPCNDNDGGTECVIANRAFDYSGKTKKIAQGSSRRVRQ